MALDKNNYVEVMDQDLERANKILSEGKTVVMPVQKGEHVGASIESGWNEYSQSNIAIKEENVKNIGTCGCGKPNDTLVYMWRD